MRKKKLCLKFSPDKKSQNFKKKISKILENLKKRLKFNQKVNQNKLKYRQLHKKSHKKSHKNKHHNKFLCNRQKYKKIQMRTQARCLHKILNQIIIQFNKAKSLTYKYQNKFQQKNN